MNNNIIKVTATEKGNLTGETYQQGDVLLLSPDEYQSRVDAEGLVCGSEGAYDTSKYTLPTFHQREFDFESSLHNADAALAKLVASKDPPLFDLSSPTPLVKAEELFDSYDKDPPPPVRHMTGSYPWSDDDSR